MDHAARIEQALMTEAGLEPRVAGDGEPWFVQTFASALASKPA